MRVLEGLKALFYYYYYYFLSLYVPVVILVKSIPNKSAKSQNKLKYSSQAPKMTPNGRASREAKWVFATVGKICFCYSCKPFMPCTIHLLFYFFLLFYLLKPHFLSLPFFLSSVLLHGCQSHANYFVF